eukprot:s1230_g10.t1
MAIDTSQAAALTQLAIDRSVMCPALQVCLMGITPGRQTISRAELTAITLAAESALLDPELEQADIITDSQYAINVIHFLETHDLAKWGHTVANFDLVQRLQKFWNARIFRIHKIKSHQDLSDAKDIMTKRWIMGNSVADKVAAKATQRCPLPLRQYSMQIAQHQKDQAAALSCVFSYLVEMNTERKMLTLQNEQNKMAAAPSSSSRQFMGQEALTAMINYSCADTFAMDFSAIDENLLKSNLQGFNLARLIVKWAQSLQWPLEDFSQESDNTKMILQWGISWFELFTNFLITTGQYCPVRISGSLANTVFVPFNSDEAKIQPSLKRSMMVQCTEFQAAVRCVTITSQGQLGMKLNYKNNSAGICITAITDGGGKNGDRTVVTFDHVILIWS